VGPLFGAVVARALDAWWEGLGRPDPFVVVEAGAGTGSLCRAVLDATPACAPALHYVLVERSERLRVEQARRLPLEPARQVLGPAVAADPEEAAHPVAGTGPVVTALDELPAGPITGVVLANELLDNLPFRLLARREDGWDEVRVGLAGRGFVEVPVPAEPGVAATADRLAPAAPPGGRIPLQEAACRWLRDALALLRKGRVVIFDYADTTAAMAARPQSSWLRTYRGHRRGGHPLEAPGEQDITCEVAVDQLAAVRRPVADRSQAAFLRDFGIEELAGGARAAWRARAHVGDLEAVRHLSRAQEASALTDPGGLGAHRVLEWVAGSPGSISADLGQGGWQPR
jgi:SAM-dependent MidA family methyltransferase